MIENNRPYYVELYTRKSFEDETDYFKLLHEFILTNCSRDLEDAGILNLFGLAPVNLSNAELNEFGDIEQILYRIKQEINIQFNTHKQTLLKAMHAYISHTDSGISNLDYFNMYGTSSYNLIWEDMCCSILDDKKSRPLRALELPKNLNPKYIEKKDLLDIIDEPDWNLSDNYKKSSSYTRPFKPDLLTFYKEGEKNIFAIMDAKYYILEDNRPGVESISKQHLYQLAYNEFINLQGFDDVRNCFLFPTTEENVINGGHVKLDILCNFRRCPEEEIAVKEIQVVLLPVKEVNRRYLENEKMDLLELNL